RQAFGNKIQLLLQNKVSGYICPTVIPKTAVVCSLHRIRPGIIGVKAIGTVRVENRILIWCSFRKRSENIQRRILRTVSGRLVSDITSDVQRKHGRFRYVKIEVGAE